MSILPVSARLPARKHLLAGVVALLSVGLMLVAVLGTAGLPTPFSAGNSARVRTSPVEADALTPTTTAPPATVLAFEVVTRDQGTPAKPTTSPTASTGNTRSPTPTTSTTLVPVPTTTPPTTAPDPDDLLSGLGLSHDLTRP